MGRTFVIAEAGSSHDNDLQKAHWLIDAAKECGADACKFQFWSNSKALAARRNIPLAEPMYAKYKLPQGWLPILAEHCERIGIEFMCSTFLIEDIHVVAPYVKRFKVSAFESQWRQFIEAHAPFRRELVISLNPGTIDPHTFDQWMNYTCIYQVLHCVSKYPTPIDDLKLIYCRELEEGPNLDGLSDHTTSTLTGAVAVGAGATIIEKHIRLEYETPKDNPDYPHSLPANNECRDDWAVPHFAQYVRNIREAERML